ncbi:TPM domain-containing protein [Leucobacter chromiiresistens]|uniref:TPM domain-containing protein n=1 Tax=Leucobacter chromiiresistens TaxID=1079994 RepID=UPI000733E7A5|nr:TPM domain-containing protein [Leucobacter chromiiresistens]
MEHSGLSPDPRPRPLGRWWLAAVLGAGLLTLGASGVAAVGPGTLGSEYVTDAVDVLDESEERAANARLAEAFDTTGLDLFVVFVDEFTDPADRIAWADETAELNGLGDSQYLLAVATDGRQYYLSSSANGELSDDALARIEERVLPELRDQDWAGAVSAAAEQLETEDAAPARTTAVVVGIGAGVLGLGGAAFGVSRLVRRRRDAAAAAEDLAQLERASGSALVAADDAVKSSAQELEFARAQFGDASVSASAEAVETARARLLEAFALRQQLDDATPDTDAQQREWLQRIMELCAAVDEVLDAQADAFARLRAIEQNAPAALAEAAARREQAGARGAQSRAELERLTAAYAADELGALDGAVQQAEQLLAFAEDRERAASTALGAAPPDSGAAAVAIREAEAAVAQADEIHRAIAARGPELASIEARCAELIGELEADVSTARAVPDADGRVAAAITATQERIAQARHDLSGAERRPGRAVQALETANAQIDGAVHSAQQAERARRLLDAQMAQADSQVRQAEAFIDARRGAVGSRARTRAAEARAALARADAARSANPESALSDAQRASSLAAEALSAAQSDVSGFGTGFGGGYGGASSAGGDLAAVLGGILGGGNGGSGYGGSGGGFWGGGSSGSWGGGSRRSSGRSGGFSRSSGRSSRRSGGSSRRSSGGRSGRRGGGRF